VVNEESECCMMGAIWMVIGRTRDEVDLVVRAEGHIFS
jgi:hypothetical protein